MAFGSSDSFESDSLDDDDLNYDDDLSYDDDDDFGDEDRGQNASKVKVALLVGAVASVAAVASAFYFLNPFGAAPENPSQESTVSSTSNGEEDSDSGSSSSSNSSQSTQSQSSSNSSADSGVTIAETVGVKHTGTQNGSRENGTSVILGFNYAYYVERSGEEAVKFFDPNNLEYDAAYIQNEIDKVPQKTKYSLEITPIVIGKDYNVRLYLQLPGTSPVVYDQTYSIDKDPETGKFFFKEFKSSEVKSQ